MPRIPTGKRNKILADIKAGKARNQIARDHKVSPGTVSNIAAENDVTDAFDRTSTATAARAKQIDNRARRAQAASDLLADIDKLRNRAWSRYQQPMSTPQGPEILELDLPPLTEVRAAYTAVGLCIDKSIAVERHDTNSGVEQAASMLAGLSDALGAAAQALETADGSPTGD